MSWINFVNDIEHEMGEGRRLANVRNFVNKSSEHVCRIAAILTIFENSQAVEITGDTLDMAISLIRYNISEILIYGIHAGGIFTFMQIKVTQKSGRNANTR